MSVSVAAVGRPRSGWPAWVPVVLGVAVVLMQVLYPRVSGETRDSLTIISVLTFGAASLTHAWIVRGWRTAAAVFGVFAGLGLLVEVIGVATGFPFGTYSYADRLGPALAGVPLVIPVAWMMLGYPALVIARRVTARPVAGALLGGLALATWDLFLDPQMVTEGYWTWADDGLHLIDAIPVSNFVAWMVIATVMTAMLWPVARGWSAEQDDRVPVALYLWTWIGSIVAHVGYFGLPQSALYGGIGMGLVVGMYVEAVRRESVAQPVHERSRATG